jgi:hypothetical protein
VTTTAVSVGNATNATTDAKTSVEGADGLSLPVDGGKDAGQQVELPVKHTVPEQTKVGSVMRMLTAASFLSSVLCIGTSFGMWAVLVQVVPAILQQHLPNWTHRNLRPEVVGIIRMLWCMQSVVLISLGASVVFSSAAILLAMCVLMSVSVAIAAWAIGAFICALLAAMYICSWVYASSVKQLANQAALAAGQQF